MFFRIVLFIWRCPLDKATVSQLTEGEKDLGILLLRQQLRIVERKQDRGSQISRWQRVPLAVLAHRFSSTKSYQAQTDDTRWHNYHIAWRSKGGPDTVDNRVLLHPNCHRQVHSQHLFVEKPRPSRGV